MKTSLLEQFPRLDHQWYIACESKALKNKPLRSVILEIPLVLFRGDSGVPTALPDRCPHRNVPLSLGKVHNGQIQCAYHGWSFDQSGQCKVIPGLTKQQKLPEYCLTPLLTKELNGYIWVFISSTHQKATVNPSEIDLIQNKHYANFRWTVSAQASFLNTAENLLDGTHTSFVHAGLLRRDSQRKEITATIFPSDNQIEVAFCDEISQSGLIPKLLEGERTRHCGRYKLPTTVELEYYASYGTRLLLVIYLIPMTAYQTQAYVCGIYRKTWFPHWIISNIFQFFLWIVLRQDIHILCSQSKNIKEFEMKEEFLSTELDIIRPFVLRLLSGSIKQNKNVREVKMNL